MEVDEPPAVLVLDEFQQYQRKNPTRNQDVPYEELQRKLRELELEPHLTALAKANASLVNFLWPFTVSKKYNEDAEQSDARRERDERRMFSMEMIVSVIVRMLDYKVWCFLPVCLTLMFLQWRVNKVVWTVCSKLLLVYSYNTARGIAGDLGSWVMSRDGFFHGAVAGCAVSSYICIVVYDNCLYNLRTKQEHVDRKNDHYQTINWMVRRLPNKKDEAIRDALADNRGAWHRGGGLRPVVSALTNFQAHNVYMLTCWSHFFTLAVGGSMLEHAWSILEHPSYESAPTKFIYQFHVPTAHGTARYEDNTKVLTVARQLVLVNLQLRLAFVVGDQQSYSGARHDHAARVAAGRSDAIAARPRPGATLRSRDLRLRAFTGAEFHHVPRDAAQ